MTYDDSHTYNHTLTNSNTHSVKFLNSIIQCDYHHDYYYVYVSHSN